MRKEKTIEEAAIRGCLYDVLVLADSIWDILVECIKLIKGRKHSMR